LADERAGEMKNKKDRVVVMSGKTMSEMFDELDAVQARLAKAEEALREIARVKEPEECLLIVHTYFAEQ
jgi:hypothetical protein